MVAFYGWLLRRPPWLFNAVHAALHPIRYWRGMRSLRAIRRMTPEQRRQMIRDALPEFAKYERFMKKNDLEGTK